MPQKKAKKPEIKPSRIIRAVIELPEEMWVHLKSILVREKISMKAKLVEWISEYIKERGGAYALNDKELDEIYEKRRMKFGKRVALEKDPPPEIDQTTPASEILDEHGRLKEIYPDEDEDLDEDYSSDE